MLRALLVEPTSAGAIATDWQPGPAHPRLAPGAVHVWRADLASVPHDLLELLSVEETARLDRFANALKGELWARSRAVLRDLLGRYLGLDPRGVQLHAGENGKLALFDERSRTSHLQGGTSPGASRPFFNLSHSGEVALYAFNDAGEVGVDVEMPRRRIDVLPLAERAFGRLDARPLRRLDPTARDQEFRRLWTAHEAKLKLDLTAATARTSTGSEDPWIAELPTPGGGAAALAVELAPSELRCWRWQPAQLSRSLKSSPRK